MNLTTQMENWNCAGRVYAPALAAVSGYAPSSPRTLEWPDTYVARLEIMALLENLNAKILASRSATLALEEWCRRHHLATEPRIVADVLKGSVQPIKSEQRHWLRVSSDEMVKHRRVRLRCADRILSEADNWYVPGRLTPELNRLLESTDTPFGKAVQPLEPHRKTLAARLLWSPLPAGWQKDLRGPAMATVSIMAIPESLFEHRAVLYTRDGTPISLVNETYKRQLLPDLRTAAEHDYSCFGLQISGNHLSSTQRPLEI
jgi:chorismate-pyruvate lyase